VAVNDRHHRGADAESDGHRVDAAAAAELPSPAMRHEPRRGQTVIPVAMRKGSAKWSARSS
jgi:hypothetical protein